jgi:Rrf2 family iron-sulfur cluster assembly transcriptional regulator
MTIFARLIGDYFVMKLTTKGRYAVTALLDLAIHQQEGPITVSQLATRHGISPAYLERLAGQMRAKGLLKSIRGSKGGYILARNPEEITLADIINAVDEHIDTTLCKGKANCHEGGVCLTHHLWDELNHKISHFFQGITLSALAEQPQVVAIAKSKRQPMQLIRLVHA